MSKGETKDERIPDKGVQAINGRFFVTIFLKANSFLSRKERKKESNSPVKFSSSFESLNFIMSNIKEEGSTSLVKHTKW